MFLQLECYGILGSNYRFLSSNFKDWDFKEDLVGKKRKRNARGKVDQVARDHSQGRHYRHLASSRPIGSDINEADKHPPRPVFG